MLLRCRYSTETCSQYTRASLHLYRYQLGISRDIAVKQDSQRVYPSQAYILCKDLVQICIQDTAMYKVSRCNPTRRKSQMDTRAHICLYKDKRHLLLQGWLHTIHSLPENCCNSYSGHHTVQISMFHAGKCHLLLNHQP